MAGAPTWYYALDLGVKAVTVGALVLGGWVGYLRYLRGRVFHAKADLELSAKLRDVQESPALDLRVNVKNSGTCRLTFPAHTIQLIEVCGVLQSEWREAVAELREPDWDKLCFYRNPIFKPGSTTDFADRELEPGQGWMRTILVPIPTDPDPVAYRARLYVEGCPRYVWRVKSALAPRSVETTVVRKL